MLTSLKPNWQSLLNNRLKKTGVAPLAEIIDHIIVRYHDRHREQLPELILQATKVERVHADKPSVPKGLTKYLTMLHEELSSHMMKKSKFSSR